MQKQAPCYGHAGRYQMGDTSKVMGNTNVWTQGGDPSLKAFSPHTVELVDEVSLPANASGARITYMVNKKQYILVPSWRRFPKSGTGGACAAITYLTVVSKIPVSIL